MPAPGDQHTPWANPFEEEKSHGQEWTKEEIASISSKLDKQLGPEYLSSRAGPGGQRVHYLAAEKAITLANEVFGFNGWSSSIQNIQVDFADEDPQSHRVSIGLSVIVRVTLRNGAYHEDVGYGSIENAKNKAMAFEKAKKEGTTDGLKRALRNFGSVLGNCVYDKDYVKQATKIKLQPTKKLNPDSLYRHVDYAKKDMPKQEIVRQESMRPEPAVASTANTALADLKLETEDSFDDFFGELDAVDFCVPEEGHPDEIMVPSNPPNIDRPVMQPPQPPPPSKPVSVSSENRPPHTPNQGHKRPMPHNGNNGNNVGPVTRPTGPVQNRPQNQPVRTGNPTIVDHGSAPAPAAFFSARAVNQLPESSLEETADNALNLGLLGETEFFNPKAESPSIRKTPGIDHSSSKPLARNGQHVAPTSSQSAAPSNPKAGGFTPVRPSHNATIQSTRGTVLNPSLDQTRRIGAPGGPGSPLANRSSYRPPSMKRTLPGEAGGAGPHKPRSPLQELPANGGPANPDATLTDGLEAKRQKIV